MTPAPLHGVFAAVLTPMKDDGSCDVEHLAAHCRNLLGEGCHGVSLFGTTGEGPALSVEERMAGLEGVLAAGVAPAEILPGTGCAALPDTVRLTRHAVGHGCCNVLLMPPFFFKDVSDSGVVDLYSRIVEDVGSSDLRIYIYNFPGITGVWVREEAIARLKVAYPAIIAGVKDSSGDWDYVTALRKRFPDIALFTGWETLVPRLLAAGGSGCISGLANVIPGLLRQLYEQRPGSAEDPLLAGVTRLVEEVQEHPTIPAIKTLAANLLDRPAWRNMRPPLVRLDTPSERRLIPAFEKTMQETEAVVLSRC